MNLHRAAKVYVSTVTVAWVFVVGFLTLATESCAAFDRRERLLETEQRGPEPAHPPSVPGPTLHSKQAFEDAAARKDSSHIYAAVAIYNRWLAAIRFIDKPVLKPGRHLQTLATTAAHLCGVPSKLFHRLIDRESNWRVHAVSSSGALGLAQIKPSTLRGVSPTLRPWVPSDRLIGAACYLRQMFDRHEGEERARWHAALLDYRYGPYRRETPSTAYADRILEVEE